MNLGCFSFLQSTSTCWETATTVSNSVDLTMPSILVQSSGSSFGLQGVSSPKYANKVCGCGKKISESAKNPNRLYYWCESRCGFMGFCKELNNDSWPQLQEGKEEIENVLQGLKTKIKSIRDVVQGSGVII